ncbi:MAG: carbamoyl phosphate synthase large subunit, partial [Eubacterium sp.]|nr:carbamoyl phosphate synthase large subunit [Eubacterium sp.]
AFYKAEEAARMLLPLEGTVLISVNDKDKPELVEVARGFAEAGFNIVATGRTFEMICAAGIPAKFILKNYEGRPNILDAITNDGIQLIVNTPAGKNAFFDDSYLRKEAIRNRIPYITTMTAAKAAAEGIVQMKAHGYGGIKSLQEWHEDIIL